MFELDNHKVKLTSINPRAELHGEDKRPAMDLKLETVRSNDVLSEFDGFLKSALYKKDDGAGSQGELIDEPGRLPVLKFPCLGPLKWDYTGSGYRLIVHYGFDGKSDIKLDDLTVDKFKFTCQDGGMVVVAFRVICHPTAQEAGRLCEMVGQQVVITLTPPEEEEHIQQKVA